MGASFRERRKGSQPELNRLLSMAARCRPSTDPPFHLVVPGFYGTNSVKRLQSVSVSISSAWTATVDISTLEVGSKER